MADSQPFDSLRLALMQEVLPMGLAFVDRVRNDGPAKAVESVARGDDPLAELRRQGEAAAREVRERLDQISPGLGNPVVSVQVEVESLRIPRMFWIQIRMTRSSCRRSWQELMDVCSDWMR